MMELSVSFRLCFIIRCRRVPVCFKSVSKHKKNATNMKGVLRSESETKYELVVLYSAASR